MVDYLDQNGVTPLVSVVMPVFNGEKYLADAIESILRQTFTDFEFIIIDDGSKDHTNSIIRSFMARDARIRLVENPENLGIIRSLNKILELANGKYAARMDADDISLPSRLRKQVDYLECHPQTDVLGCTMEFFDSDPTVILGSQHYPSQPALIKWFLFFGNPFGHPTILMRMRALQGSGGYCEDYRHAEDYELWSRLINNVNGANLEEPLLKYRIHSSNVSLMFRQEQKAKSNAAAMRLLTHFINAEQVKEFLRLVLDGVQRSKREKLKACRMILHLYNQFSSRSGSVPIKEKTMILADALNRIYRIAASDKGHPVLFLYWLGIGIVRAVGLLFLRLTGRYSSKNYLDVDAYRKETNIESM